MMLFNKTAVIDLLRKAIKTDLNDNCKKGLYEWDYDEQRINQYDENVQEQYLDIKKMFGFTKKEHKYIEFDEYRMKLVIYSNNIGNESGIDPLCMFVGGYMKAENEIVHFELDFEYKGNQSNNKA